LCHQNYEIVMENKEEAGHGTISSISAAPKLSPEDRKLVSAKLGAINDYYEAKVKVSRLNKELFDRGLVVGSEVMCW
jgi:hypothetical protein